MKDHPAVTKYAYSFAATTGMDKDDLLQEGRIAHWNATLARDGIRYKSYNPRKASFDTYATMCVRTHLQSVAEHNKRKITTVGEIDDAIPDYSTPSPDRNLLLTELIQALPDDAKAVVSLILGDDPIAAVGLTAKKAKMYIRRRLGLSASRAQAAFSAVEGMLGSM